MALVKCSTTINQGGYRLDAGQVVDTASVFYALFPSSFTAQDAELDTLVAGAPANSYTQTYSTPARTVPAALGTLVLTATSIAGKTPSTTLTDSGTANAGAVAASLDQAQADLGTQINTVTADVLALKKLVNGLIDDLQTLGLVT